MSPFYTSSAEVDLCHIWLHVAEHSAVNADSVVQRLMDDLLARNSGLGQACDEYGRRLRRFSKGSYVIYFRPVDSGIEVTRIFHGSQDATVQFHPDDFSSD